MMGISKKPVFSTEYESAELVIVSQGSTVLTHGLGKTPKRAEVWIKCVVSEITLGYVIGDMVRVLAETSAASGSNINLKMTETSIALKVGNAANPLKVLNSSGQTTTLTTNRWVMIVKAYA